jgi:uncharacterized protein
METITLFGATGSTGKHVLEQALKTYKVRAMVRDPVKVTAQSDNLTVIKGDFSNMIAVKDALKGADYVISTSGGRLGDAKNYDKLFMKRFVEALWPLMKEERTIKAFLYQAGAFSSPPGKKLPLVLAIMRGTMGRMMGFTPNVQDNDAVLAFIDSQLKDAATTTFKTIVTRPGMISEGPSKIKLMGSETKTPTGSIQFIDLAAFSLEAIKDESLYGKYLYVIPQ